MKENLEYSTVLMASLRSWSHLLLCSVLFSLSFNATAQRTIPSIIKNSEGKIERTQDSLGNRIPDFSYCGYKNNTELIPDVAVQLFVPHHIGNATLTIQRAIDIVSELPLNSEGFRGAIVLDEGTFEIEGQLHINTSGVILRGTNTTLLGKGILRKSIISISGSDDRSIVNTYSLATSFTPLGSDQIDLTSTAGLKVGDHILIETPITQKWIDLLKMNEFGGETGWIGWKSDDFTIRADREVMSISGTTIELDAPLTNALDEELSTSVVKSYNFSGRIEKVGIENISFESTYNSENEKDEQHRWYAVTINHVKDAWLRNASFKHFAGGAVALLKNALSVTVENCIASEPISEVAAFRRNTFYTEGQLTFFKNCYSEYGYHDFVVGGYATPGPNVFFQCESEQPYSYSGSIGSWNSGMLFDIVSIDGDALSFANKGQDSRGLGWNAVNSVMWASNASRIENYNPPIGQNWAFGVWGQFAGDGSWNDVNNHISPKSLFYALREQRTNIESLKSESQIAVQDSEPTSSPTYEQAVMLTELAAQPRSSLKDWIVKQGSKQVYDTNFKNVKKLQKKIAVPSKKSNAILVSIEKGKLVGSAGLITGNIQPVPWWRGSLRESTLVKSQPHITRFVPAKEGLGLTDDLSQTVKFMVDQNSASLDHNYGLWYERRMDDHERVRRFDADVWAPFYEQPFDRSGQELAWDGLSKYDLTNYNDWYWSRLKSFAELAAQEDKILLNQNYFQHNILEAGAHWSSSPWRSANNINSTGFPEPPPYAGDKRIFMSKQFYDVTNEHRRELHHAFIEKNLENFKDNSNVLQLISAEYTGPLHFMEFWLEVIKNYEKKHSNQSKITLSATKDVQDAILSNPKFLDVVDVIDIKYWYYKEDGTTYAPEGGKFLAPRQHARKLKTGKETERQVYRAVREYRHKFPDKAVIYSANSANRFGWPVLMAGGSLAAIPKIEIAGFNKSLAAMTANTKDTFDSPVWSLQNEGVSYLFDMHHSDNIELDLSQVSGSFRVYYINKNSGKVYSEARIKGRKKHKITLPSGEKQSTVVFINKV